MKAQEVNREMVNEITKKLVDGGFIVEAGWMSFKLLTLSPHAPAEQVEALRLAFFAGAQHLWGSIFSVLDSGSEPTERDLRRMDIINRELQEFIKNFKREKLNEQ